MLMLWEQFHDNGEDIVKTQMLYGVRRSILHLNLLRFWLGEPDKIISTEKNDRVAHVVTEFSNGGIVTQTHLEKLYQREGSDYLI
jgi:hypothetical protein